MESETHRLKVKETLKRLETEGYKVIDLENKSPDGIAIKDGKVIAVEVLGLQLSKKGHWRHSWSVKSKHQIYHMFDDLIIETFKYPKYLK